MEEKRLKDMTEEEYEDFVRMVKWDRFQKWARNINEDEDTLRDIEEITKHTGIKKTAPVAMMAAGFFAGVEVGAEIMREFLELDDEEKNPASAPTLTGQAS